MSHCFASDSPLRVEYLENPASKPRSKVHRPLAIAILLVVPILFADCSLLVPSDSNDDPDNRSETANPDTSDDTAFSLPDEREQLVPEEVEGEVAAPSFVAGRREGSKLLVLFGQVPDAVEYTLKVYVGETSVAERTVPGTDFGAVIEDVTADVKVVPGVRARFKDDLVGPETRTKGSVSPQKSTTVTLEEQQTSMTELGLVWSKPLPILADRVFPFPDGTDTDAVAVVTDVPSRDTRVGSLVRVYSPTAQVPEKPVRSFFLPHPVTSAIVEGKNLYVGTACTATSTAHIIAYDLEESGTSPVELSRVALVRAGNNLYEGCDDEVAEMVLRGDILTVRAGRVAVRALEVSDPTAMHEIKPRSQSWMVRFGHVVDFDLTDDHLMIGDGYFSDIIEALGASSGRLEEGRTLEMKIEDRSSGSGNFIHFLPHGRLVVHWSTYGEDEQNAVSVFDFDSFAELKRIELQQFIEFDRVPPQGETEFFGHSGEALYRLEVSDDAGISLHGPMIVPELIMSLCTTPSTFAVAFGDRGVVFFSRSRRAPTPSGF